ncbi:leucine-rich repeat-containing G-protein coupled receptor 4-like [Zophobas morio]|uniref:leucine-rich repeat-containing G-protein coupled receptor 4-like n=1 Tax=Zophobas morio TaxID=2755281 RepID=UPI003082B6D8
MCSLPFQLLLVIFLLKISDAREITFKNVTILYVTASKNETRLGTADNLKKIIPSGEKLSVKVTGVVPVLYEQSIHDIHNLESLQLNEESLKEIKPGAFGNLPLLRYLDLSENKITEIKSGTFSNLNLSLINLAFSSIKSLQPGAFKNVIIGELALSGNSRTELPLGIFENVTLKSLDLSSNRMHTISSKALPRSLRNLNLKINRVESIDSDNFNHPELTSLDLSYNQIKLLRPGDLKNLPRLKKLTLESNMLTEIPDGVFNNTTITDLNLQFNQIATIATKAFDHMPKLKRLSIMYNNNLTLWDNNWLAGSSELSALIVNNNRITEIPDEAFKNYRDVFHIDLAHNKISKISMKAFHNVGHIHILDLAANEIDSWNPDWVANVSIDRIDLNWNKFNGGRIWINIFEIYE